MSSSSNNSDHTGIPARATPTRRFFLVSTLLFAGCGFTPAYGPGGAASVLRGTVIVDPPTDRNSFNLVGQLERKFGQVLTPRYALSYTLRVSEDGVGVTPEQELVRFNVVGKATYSLRDISSGSLLTSGSVNNFTAYTVGSIDTSVSPPRTSSTIATLAAKRDARSRLMVAIADQIFTKLIATSGDWSG